MPAFGIIHRCAAPRLYHTLQHLRKFCAALAVCRKHLGIVATDVVNYFERFAGLGVYERVLHLLGNPHTVFVNDVACMGDVFGE